MSYLCIKGLEAPNHAFEALVELFNKPTGLGMKRFEELIGNLTLILEGLHVC